MNQKAIIGLVRSRMAYVREWPECVAAYTVEGEAAPERVFDLSELLVDEDAEIDVDHAVAGRHLPFPVFAIVGSGHGVFIVSGDDEGMYAYCYSSPVQMLLVRFTPTGWTYEGIARQEGSPPESIRGDDPRVQRFAEATGLLLALTERACANTRHVVSYTLNRAERRNAIKETGFGTLDNTLVHHVCLNAESRRALAQRRGDTVVPTPKRLHEVRAHWRHLQTGAVVRVRSHRRGTRGDVPLPRVYTAEGSTAARQPGSLPRTRDAGESSTADAAPPSDV